MDDILDKLATVLAASASLNYAVVPAGEHRQLYLYQVDEKHCDPTAAAALRPTGGATPSTYSPIDEMTAQIYALGATQRDALELAWAIYSACKDAKGLPLRNVTIAECSMRFLRIDAIQPPAVIGVNESGRAEAVFNIAFAVAKEMET